VKPPASNDPAFSGRSRSLSPHHNGRDRHTNRSRSRDNEQDQYLEDNNDEPPRYNSPILKPTCTLLTCTFCEENPCSCIDEDNHRTLDRRRSLSPGYNGGDRHTNRSRSRDNDHDQFSDDSLDIDLDTFLTCTDCENNPCTCNNDDNHDIDQDENNHDPLDIQMCPLDCTRNSTCKDHHRCHICDGLGVIRNTCPLHPICFMCFPHKDIDIVNSIPPPICHHCTKVTVIDNPVDLHVSRPAVSHHRTRSKSNIDKNTSPAIFSSSNTLFPMTEDYDIDDTYDKIESLTSHVESTLGLKSCDLNWISLPEDATEEILCCSKWPISDQRKNYEIVFSKHSNVVRIITLLPTKVTIRYITPFNTWSYTSSFEGTDPHFINIEPCEIINLPVLAGTFAQVQGAKHHASVHIIIQLLLDSFFPPLKDGISSSSIDDLKHNYFLNNSAGIAAYTGKGRAHDSNPDACCPACGICIRERPACQGIYTFKVCPMYKRITAFCDNKKSRTRPIREGDLSTLFGLNMGKQPKNNTPTLNENLHDPDNHNSEFDLSFPPPDLNFHLSPSPVTEECITKKNDYLVVLSVNLDTTGKTSFVPSLLYAEERNADVFLLQEVENIPLNRAGILARGWTPHRHKQCMILLRTKTAGRYLRTSDDNGNSITPVWKSSTFNSMAVSINTPM
jgi:hypothetical protein